MINLITGTPGAGKTLNTLAMVEDECAGRNIYFYNIKGLTLDWQEVTKEDLHTWDEFPDGSVFVVDEAWKVWPNVTNSQKSPESVMKLAEHRHRGFDFYFIVQDPTLIDFRLRKFGDRHYHFERQFGYESARRFEWQSVVSNPKDHFARKEAVSTRISYPKKYYDVYQSASLHTVTKRFPKKAYWVIGGVVLSIGLLIYALNTIGDGPPEIAQYNSPGESQQFASSFSSYSSRRDPEQRYESTQDYIDQHTPRIDDIPWSAPMYDAITEVQTFPRPQCIYHIKDDYCSCFTQQATPLEISKENCLSQVKNGYFNPFKSEETEQGSGRALAAAPAITSEPTTRKVAKVRYIGESSNQVGSQTTSTTRYTPYLDSRPVVLGYPNR